MTLHIFVDQLMPAKRLPPRSHFIGFCMLSSAEGRKFHSESDVCHKIIFGASPLFETNESSNVLACHPCADHKTGWFHRILHVDHAFMILVY